MSSRSKNFRRRPQDAEEETTTTTTSTTTTKPSSNLTTKSSTKNPKRLISFADEEQEDSSTPSPSLSKPNRIKPSSSSSSRLSKPSLSSHKLTTKDRLTAPPSIPSSSAPSNVQPQAGEYTKEKLLELQKNTRTLVGSRHHPPSSSEPVFRLKGIVKPVDKVEENAELEEEEEEEDTLLFRKSKEDAESRFASMGIGKNRDLDGNLIMDQAMINAIKAQKERARQSKAAAPAPDFISLDGGSNHGAAEGLSDEEPEFRNRIEMIGDMKDVAKKGVFESFEVRGAEVNSRRNEEMGVVGDDEDDEEEKWVEEQVRKGLGKRISDNSAGMASNSVPGVSQSAQQPGYAYPAVSRYQPAAPSAPVGPTIGGSAGVSRSADVMSISQQAEVATQALHDNIRRLKESHGRTISAMTRNDENLSSSLSNVTALEISLSAAGERFIFMQKLRDFVSVICEFLQHKAPYIEELEEQMQKLQEDRASAIVERRAADNADEMMEVEAGVGAAMSVFGKAGSNAAGVSAATTAAQAALTATKEQSSLPVQLDEFGRDINLQKRMDTMRRAEARKRRKAKSESRRMSSVGDDNARYQIEGESSTDESDSECTSYRSNRNLLLQTAEQIFSDASEDYSQLSVVKERFETWKKHYSSTYRDAYMSLSAPAIFSPYVRLALLKWDPLYEDTDFLDMQWHSLLFDYGLPENGNDFSLDDADANLVPGLVEKVALPILHHQIAHCWDMFSTRGTKNAVYATNLVINYVPASSEALRELLAAIHARLADAIANLNVPTWTPIVTRAVPNAGRVAAYRFGISIRLLRNICLWKDILALPVLEQLALEELLGGKVLPHVRSITSNIQDAMTRTERIVASLSGVWTGPSATTERRHKLQPLVEYVLTLGKVLEKRQMSSEGDISGLARRLKKMLVELNEYDKARGVSRTFHLKEAL